MRLNKKVPFVQQLQKLTQSLKPKTMKNKFMKTYIDQFIKIDKTLPNLKNISKIEAPVLLEKKHKNQDSSRSNNVYPRIAKKKN